MRIASLTAGVVLLAFSSPLFGAVSDLVTRENFRASLCNIASMSIRTRIDEAFGEPLLTSSVRWDAGPNTAADCLSGLTTVWLRVRLGDGSLRYIKLSPLIGPAGQTFGEPATESPMWSFLFCNSPDDSSRCESPDSARQIFATAFDVEGFEVQADVGALTTLTSPTRPSAGSERASGGDAFSLDSLLEEAIYEAAGGGTDPVQEEAAPDEPALTAEQLAQLEQEQRDERARSAVNNVVTLIAASLAEYRAPSTACEDGRVINNWVQSRGTCQLNFRSESTHRFTCGGDATSVRSTRRANLDLSKDLRRVSPVRVSQDGWASVVLELEDKLHAHTEGGFSTDRWHFTTEASRAADLQTLASSILTLKDYCEEG